MNFFNQKSTPPTATATAAGRERDWVLMTNAG